MSVAFLTDRQYTAPAAAANVTLTPSGSAWSNSAWVELHAAMPAASVLTGIVVSTNWGDGPSTTNTWEIDVGTGGAGSEVVIATFNGVIRGSFGQNPDSMLWIPCVIGIDNIANGVRLAARIRHSSTDVTVWTVAATYLQKPISGSTILTTAQPLLPVPPAAAAVAITAGGSAWASGSWAELRAASGAALVLVGVAIGVGSSSVEYEIDIGTGASSSEVVITTIRIIGASDNAIFGNVPFGVPLDNIAASTRMAARARASTGSATARVTLSVIEKPL